MTTGRVQTIAHNRIIRYTSIAACIILLLTQAPQLIQAESASPTLTSTPDHTELTTQTHELDPDEFESADTQQTQQPHPTDDKSPDPIGPSAATVIQSTNFIDSFVHSALGLIGMSSSTFSTSSFISRHWLSMSIGGIVAAGALWLGLSKPWKSGGRRKPKKEEDPRAQPLLVELKSKRGRVQGHDWVEKSLRKDKDGDEAHDFLGPF